MTTNDRSVVPYLSPAALFIRGMVARCPALRPLAELVARQDMMRRVRCEHIVASMIRVMPYLPRFKGEDAAIALADASNDDLKAMVVLQREHAVVYFHRHWAPFWKDEEPHFKRFGAKCATILTETYRLKRASLTRRSACA